MSKKILSLLVVLSMLLSIAPMTANVYADSNSVNIFTNGSGSKLPGVSVVVHGNDAFSNGEVYDGDMYKGEYLAKNASTNRAYIQIDLGAEKKDYKNKIYCN